MDNILFFEHWLMFILVSLSFFYLLVHLGSWDASHRALHWRVDYARPVVRWADPVLLALVVGLSTALSKADGGTIVSFIDLLSGLLALGLFIYLFAALLKPEWFS